MQTVNVVKVENTFSIDTAMTQVDYNALRDAAGTHEMSTPEAIDQVCSRFGFDPFKVKIETEAELNVYVGTCSTKKSGVRVARPPLYNATDWNYNRFRVCGILWECVNGNLEQIAE